MSEKRDFTFELEQAGGKRNGYIRLTLAQDALWIEAKVGYNNRKDTSDERERYTWSLSWSEPHIELVLTFVRVGLKLMPPWAFADWLQESEFVVSIEQFDPPHDPKSELENVLRELRRFAKE